MWNVLRATPGVDPGFVVSATDLIRLTFRSLVYATTAAYAVGHVLATVNFSPEMGARVWLITLLFAGAVMVVLWLLPRRLRMAQAVWLASLYGGITLALHLFGEPSVALLYAFLPLAAVVTLGWPGALIAEGAIGASVFWLAPLLLGGPIPGGFGAMIVAGGLLSGLIGWSSMSALVYLAQWSFTGYTLSRQAMDEALEQRLALKETQEDLLKANIELARTYDRMKTLHQMADEARRAKEEFVANVSHELRTPLNMIIGFSEMITESPEVYDADLPAPLLTDIAAIKRNSDHLSKLVDDVLDLSQAEAGRTVLSKEWVSMPAVVDEAAEAVRVLYQSKHLYLRIDVPPDLPKVHCDPTRARQVIINLLSNAGRFTEHGGVTLSARRLDGRMVISVADTGPGISEENQKKLFEPFQQLDSSIRRKQGGSGLGLAISKRFVEMHHGRMWVDSVVGAGTTFHFSLPLDPPEADTAPLDTARRWINVYEEPSLKLRARPARVPELRVLPRFVLLESGPTLSRLFSRYVSRDSAELVAVSTPEEAAQALSRSPAQALIVNTWPELDTASITAQVRELAGGTPVLVCSVPAGALPAGLNVAKYLVKPVKRDQLLAALRSIGRPASTVLLVDDDIEVQQLFGRILAG